MTNQGLGVLASWLLVVGQLALSPGAFAQDDEEEKHVFVPDEKELTGGKADGVEWQVEAAANLTMGDNRNVVGQIDGTSLTVGYKTAGMLEARQDGHESRNRALAAAAISYSPAVNDFVKMRDQLAFETIYLYHIIKWLGPFARAGVTSAALQGADVRGVPTRYQISRRDGTVDSLVRRRLPLTDPFRPTRFKQSVGMFVQPMSYQAASMEVRAGVGAREVLADDQLAVTDDEETEDVVEVEELRDVYQVGGEGVLEMWGDGEDKKVIYRAFVEVLVPFVQSDLDEDDERSTLDFVTVEAGGSLGIKLVEWATVEYELAILREPLVIDALQVRNTLLLNFGFIAGNIPEAKAE